MILFSCARKKAHTSVTISRSSSSVLPSIVPNLHDDMDLVLVLQIGMSKELGQILYKHTAYLSLWSFLLFGLCVKGFFRSAAALSWLAYTASDISILLPHPFRHNVGSYTTKRKDEEGKDKEKDSLLSNPFSNPLNPWLFARSISGIPTIVHRKVSGPLRGVWADNFLNDDRLVVAASSRSLPRPLYFAYPSNLEDPGSFSPLLPGYKFARGFTTDTQGWTAVLIGVMVNLVRLVWSVRS